MNGAGLICFGLAPFDFKKRIRVSDEILILPLEFLLTNYYTFRAGALTASDSSTSSINLP